MDTKTSLPAPRLRILHLFLWTAATALVLLVIQPALDVHHRSPQRAEIFRGLYAAYSVIAGVFVAGLLYWALAIAPRIVRARELSEGWGRHPGHWLLLLGGVETFCGHLMALLLQLAGHPRELLGPGVFIVASYVLSTVVTVSLWLHLIVRGDWSATWRIGIIVLAIARIGCCFASPWCAAASVIGSANLVLNELELSDLAIPITLPTIAFAGLFLVAPLDDWRNSTRRDSFHWIGIGATLLLFVWIWCWSAIVSWNR